MSGPELIHDVVARGELEIIGRMPWSSNGTYLAEAHLDDAAVRVVYKPHAGERPLWDFPDGLWRREVAAYELSEALGWQLIPLTIARDDVPLGIGSLQVFVDVDYDDHYFTFVDDAELHPQLRRFAAFDFISNNTDRKGGHLLLASDRHIWGIDNGLSFHADFKLRTVIWEFGGDELDDETMRALQRLVDDGLPDSLASLLGAFEREAVLARTRALLRNGALPVDETGHRYPWPLV